MDDPEPIQPESQGRGWLWSPWRMRYVGGEHKESGCIFCNRLAGDDDVDGLVLARGAHSFTIMNLFPYNTGHVMQVPNQHVASPESADPSALAEVAATLPALLRALRRVLDCHGFNIGLNVGAVAGAGVADHLHQHVVPRWTGDANFMPIVGGVMVMPELIPVTYAKLRAELTREFGGNAVSASIVILDSSRAAVVIDASGRLPQIEMVDSVAVWKTAADYARNLGLAASVTGWCGPSRASSAEIGLTLTADAQNSTQADWVSLEEATSVLPMIDRPFLARALQRPGEPARSRRARGGKS